VVDGLVGREHPVRVAGRPQLLDARGALDRREHRLARVGVPGRVRRGVVEQVRADPGPQRVGVGIDERDGDRVRRRLDEGPGLDARLGARCEVGLAEAVGLGDHAEPEPRGPLRRHRRAAAEGNGGSSRRERCRRHPERRVAPRKRLAPEGGLHGGDRGVEPGAAVALRDAEEVVLLLPVAEPEDVADATAAHKVQHGHVLGHLHRIVQRRQQRHHPDRDALGAGRDRRGQHQR
jgi:hypothetical protein